MRRLIACDRKEQRWFDIDWDALETARFREVLNGEHSIDLVTTQAIDEGTRLLWQDATNRWHEWAVDEVDLRHALGDATVGTYGGTWSVQYDMATVSGGEIWVSSEVGAHVPITAASALSLVLATQSRWEVGNVTVATTGACSLYDGSAWEYLGKLVETFGGEMEPRIVVEGGRVTHRYVDWLAHVGTESVTRRFDFGHDCTEIRKTEQAGPRYCRIRPRGGSVRTDADGVDASYRVGIEDDEYVPTWTSDDGELSHVGGTDYIEDLVAAANFDNGTHPTKVVIYDTDDDGELFDLAAADITNYTRPQATYTATVVQFARAGLDPHGVSLGDEVHVVDSTFGPAPMRLEVRVTERTVNMLDESDVELVIGPKMKTLAMAFEQVRDEAKRPVDEILAGGTIAYVEKLLDAINAELNTVGGWKYEVAGQGTFTYDRAVSDPPIGTGATRCVHVGGGFVRFANTRDQAGDWEWTNVITPEGYLGLAATIARITTGFIGSADGGNFWNLDNGNFRLSPSANIGGRSVQDALYVIVSDADVEYAKGASQSTAPDDGWSTTPPSWESGKYVWSRVKVTAGPTGSTVVTYTAPVMISGHNGSSSARFTSIETRYYLSTSCTTQSGGGWSNAKPTLTSGSYLWLRSKIAWDTSPAETTTTEPVLATAMRSDYDLLAYDRSLGQAEIFNRLTNGGQWQGIFTHNGHYYFNADYIQSGTMSANLISGGTFRVGGDNNANGVLQVFDASSNEICRLDNNGAVMTGEISMRSTCDVWDGSSSTPYYMTVDVRIGETRFISPDVYQALIGAIASRPKYCLPGLAITGISNNVNLGSLSIVPTFGGTSPNIIYSTTKPILMCVGRNNNTYIGGEIHVESDSVSISYRSSQIEVYDNNGSQDIEFTFPYGDVVFRESNASKVEFGYFYANTSHIGPAIEIHGSTHTYKSISIDQNLTVGGTKNRVVDTDSYSDRLLYCYETTSPLFGDVGSAVIGDDGVCVVSIDDVFSECARTDMAYQVFLQKCGRGDLWVREKTPTHFVVEGTPLLPFDWEVKAHQVGYESDRMESAAERDGFDEASSDGFGVLKAYDTASRPEDEQGQFDAIYADELSYVTEIESLYQEER